MSFDSAKTSGHRAKKPTYCSLCDTWQISTFNHDQGKRHRKNAEPYRQLLAAHRATLRSLRETPHPPSDTALSNLNVDTATPMLPATLPKAAIARPASARPARPIVVAAPTIPVVEPAKPTPVVEPATPTPVEPATPTPVEPATPVVEPANPPSPIAAADGVTLEWDPDYKALAINMPPSIIAQIEKRLAKLKLSPATQADAVDAEIVRVAIEKACQAYENKRVRAKASAAARRAAKKEAAAIHKLDAEAASSDAEAASA